MLTAAEEAELAQLNGASGGLSPEEEAELAQLNGVAGVQAPAAPQTPKIENEMHPDMTGLQGLKARTVYKALGADPEASLKYLQKEFPKLKFSTDPEGEVLVMSQEPGSKTYRLDPKGLDIRDVTDLAYDIPAGVAQGAATAAAGLAAAPAGGVAAIPAAMAASGASGAGLEALRQKLGNLMGIDQEVSGKDVAVSGAFGAASPLVFGTGAGMSQAASQAAKQAAQTGAKTTAQDILATQRGLVGRGYDAAAGWLGPKLANLASGENEKVIRQAAKMLPEIKAADTNPNVLAEPLSEAAEKVPQVIKQKTRDVGTRLEELRNVIDSQPNPNQTPGLVLAGEGASRMQGSIDAKPFVQPFRDLVEGLEKNASGSAAEKADIQKLKDIIQDEFTGMDEFLTAAQVDAKMKRFKELAQSYGMNYGNTGTTQSTLTGKSAVDKMVAKAFEDSRREMSNAIIGRLEQINPKYGQEYLQSNEAYSQLLDMAKDQKGNFKNAKSVQNFLNKATSNDIDAADLEKVQSLTGVDLEDLAVKSQAIKAFSKPLTEIRSLGRSTTARQAALGVGAGTLGYYAGQQSGGEYSPFLLAAIMGGIGSKAASPAMLRKYMEANAVMRQLPAEIPGGRFMPYMLMNANNNDQEK